jgi:hypothetical protein
MEVTAGSLLHTQTALSTSKINIKIPLPSPVSAVIKDRLVL